MKTKPIKLLATVLILVIAVGTVFSVSATKYVAKPVSENFETATLFLAPGDMDFDGEVDSSDYEQLRELLLFNAASLYSDVNGDEITNICDLVLQNENLNEDFIAGGKMYLNGKSVYRKDFVSSLSTGAEYKVTYTATGDVKVKLAGLSDTYITASGYTFKTPLNLSNKEIELYVIGNGTIENISIVRVNMDNEFSLN